MGCAKFVARQEPDPEPASPSLLPPQRSLSRCARSLKRCGDPISQKPNRASGDSCLCGAQGDSNRRGRCRVYAFAYTQALPRQGQRARSACLYVAAILLPQPSSRWAALSSWPGRSLTPNPLRHHSSPITLTLSLRSFPQALRGPHQPEALLGFWGQLLVRSARGFEPSGALPGVCFCIHPSAATSTDGGRPCLSVLAEQVVHGDAGLQDIRLLVL
jgi:hypothetical protein